MPTEYSNGYDVIAPYYDNLVGLIFGQPLFNAQVHYIQYIEPKANILILGGGTGWLLEIIDQRVANCKVTYIDASAKMIDLAKKRSLKNIQVNFIQGTEMHIPDGAVYDVIITNFYFDMFRESDLNKLVASISLHLKSNGLWMACDFIKPINNTQRGQAKLMLRLFRLLCKHPNSIITDWELGFRTNNIKEEETSYFLKRFIKTSIRRK